MVNITPIINGFTWLEVGLAIWAFGAFCTRAWRLVFEWALPSDHE